MKYYHELSKEDQERAVNKLVFMNMTKPSKTTLLRVLVKILQAESGYVNIPGYSSAAVKELKEPGSVTAFYFKGKEVLCDVVLDINPNNVIRDYPLANLLPCEVPEIQAFRLSAEELERNKKAVETLLKNGKSFMFDDRCNAYPA